MDLFHSFFLFSYTIKNKNLSLILRRQNFFEKKIKIWDKNSFTFVVYNENPKKERAL